MGVSVGDQDLFGEVRPLSLASCTGSMSSAKQLSREKYISLETYRKSGAAVRTPVWLVEDGGVIYVRTDPTSGKAKRIRRDPRVKVAPSNVRGKPSGPYVEGKARFVQGADAERILEMITKRYGTMGRLVESVNSLRGRHATAAIAIELA